MDNTKYYVPEMNEFHPDFEFEMLYPDGEYHKQIAGADIDHPELKEFSDDLMKIAHAITRVKLLDKEDIIAEGWYSCMVLKNGEPHNFINGYDFHINETDNAVLHYDGDKIHIYIQHMYNEHSGNWTMKTIFYGTLKNRSELHKLMQQLGIQSPENQSKLKTMNLLLMDGLMLK